MEASDNPHNVTKSDEGLGNVDNTSDEDKPVSTAQYQLFNGHAGDTDNPHNATCCSAH